MPDPDELFKALADPTRRVILQTLRDGPMNAGQLAAKLRIAPSALSFHLRMLRNADFIHHHRRGQFIRYGLNATVMKRFICSLANDFAGEPPAAASESRPIRRSVDVTPPSPPASPEDQQEQADDVTLL